MAGKVSENEIYNRLTKLGHFLKQINLMMSYCMNMLDVMLTAKYLVSMRDNKDTVVLVVKC